MDKLEEILEMIRESRLPSAVIIPLINNILTLQGEADSLSKVNACRVIFENDALKYCETGKDYNLCLKIQKEMLDFCISEFK